MIFDPTPPPRMLKILREAMSNIGWLLYRETQTIGYDQKKAYKIDTRECMKRAEFLKQELARTQGYVFDWLDCL